MRTRAKLQAVPPVAGASLFEPAVNHACAGPEAGIHDFHVLADVERTLETGSTLFWAGSPCRAIYVLRAGTLLSCLESSSGDSQILMVHLPGEIVGTDVLNRHRVHTSTCVALEPSSVGVISHAMLHEVVETCPSCLSSFMQELSVQAQQLQTHLQMLGRTCASQRLALFLLDLSKRFHRLHRDPRLLVLPISRGDLANYLGMVVETVSRVLGAFQMAGVITVERRAIRLLDLERLREIAAGAPLPPASR